MGMNIVAIESRTHNILIKRSYDTSKSAKQSRALARDLRSLPSGTIVMAAVRGDAVEAMTDGVYSYFASQGSKEILKLQPGQMFAFVGVKDQT
jgi:hypothetical protein